MGEETELRLTLKGGSALVFGDARSRLIARGQSDAALLVQGFSPEPDPLQLRQRAEAGDANAQVKLGDEYSSRSCWRCSRNECESRSNRNGNTIEKPRGGIAGLRTRVTPGPVELGEAYRQGRGVRQDSAEAVRVVSKSGTAKSSVCDV